LNLALDYCAARNRDRLGAYLAFDDRAEPDFELFVDRDVAFDLARNDCMFRVQVPLPARASRELHAACDFAVALDASTHYDGPIAVQIADDAHVLGNKRRRAGKLVAQSALIELCHRLSSWMIGACAFDDYGTSGARRVPGLTRAGDTRRIACSSTCLQGNYVVKRSSPVLFSAVLALAILMLSAGCGGRQADWEAARKADSADAYQQFLQRYPDGDFTSQAKARIEDLKEEADWKAALATDTAAGYQQFLGLHPDGARADEARIRVENLNLAQAPVDAPQGSAGEAAPPTAVAPGKPAAPSKPVLAPKPAVASKPVAKPSNQIAAAPAGKYRVQLGAFSSATRARSEWQAAVKNHRTLLAGLSYTLDKVTSGKNTLFRLQSTAVTESRARSICAALKTAKQDCVVVLP